jgi:hypothetical protein
MSKSELACKLQGSVVGFVEVTRVTSQDFIKFWGNFFCFYFACVD